jgi:hypothetical protein
MNFLDNPPNKKKLLSKVKDTEKKNKLLSKLLSNEIENKVIENELLSKKLEDKVKENESLSKELEDEKNIEYKMIDMQHYLVYLKKKCQQNDISNRNLSVIFLSNEKVLEKLNNPNMTLEEQLNHDIETLKQIIQRILGIQTYIEKKQLEQEGGTKKNKKRQRKSRKKNKVLN